MTPIKVGFSLKLNQMDSYIKWIKNGQLLGAFITNETPAYLGYEDYRGWVLINTGTGKLIYQDKKWPNASIAFGAPIRNLDYGYLYTVVSITPSPPT